MSATKLKLSPKQKEVIRLMRDGYELGHSSGWGAGVWLQLGGCGKGGKTAKVSFGTFWAILDRKLIVAIKGQGQFEHPTRYELTASGKTCIID